MQADFDRAIARLPVWMLALGIAGAASSAALAGKRYAASFLIGAVGAYFNFRLIERTVNRLGELALAQSSPPRAGSGVWLFIRFICFVLGAFVILRFSGFNIAAVFWGFLVCPAAAILEIVFELLTYGHS